MTVIMMPNEDNVDCGPFLGSFAVKSPLCKMIQSVEPQCKMKEDSDSDGEPDLPADVFAEVMDLQNADRDSELYLTSGLAVDMYLQNYIAEHDSTDFSGLLGMVNNEEVDEDLLQVIECDSLADVEPQGSNDWDTWLANGGSYVVSAVAAEHDYSRAAHVPAPPPLPSPASTTSGYFTDTDEAALPSEDSSISWDLHDGNNSLIEFRKGSKDATTPNSGGKASSRTSMDAASLNRFAGNPKSLLTEETLAQLKQHAAAAKAQRVQPECKRRRSVPPSRGVSPSSSSSSLSSVSSLSSQASYIEDPPPARKRNRAGSSANTNSCVLAYRNKKWSNMDNEERTSAITELTDIISEHLQLRERLEAVKIVNPHLNINHTTDTEVSIDLTPINDSRFRKLQAFVRRHADGYGHSSTAKTPTQLQNSRSTPKTSLNATDNLHRPAKQKWKGNFHKGVIPLEELNQKRLMDHVKLERQSGLFKQEQFVVCKTEEIEDDIDILS